MTREEIREGIENHLYTLVGMVRFKDRTTDPESIEQCLNILWEYLHSQGVVIQVDRKLPDNEAWHKVEREFEAYCAGKNELIMAGLVPVEPLIKELNGNQD